MELSQIAKRFTQIPILESGARHSKSDIALLQTIHDHALSLGAGCKMAEAADVLEAVTSISNSDVAGILSAAIKDHYEGEYSYTYVTAVLGDDRTGDVVYYASGDLWRCAYTITKTDVSVTCKVNCDNAIEVNPVTQYLAAESAAIQVTGDAIPLREGAVGQDGSAYLKLIAPGWGSSGYYSEKLLQRDGPTAFKAGTKNFWNHQTDAEEAARPEGDLRDLASVLTEDAHYDKEGAAGPGLYARAKVFEEFRQPVDDLAKHIGMSIRASGIAKEGTAEGRKGSIIEKLTQGISVDYVTTPGAGGKILQLFEAAPRAAKRLKESAIPTQEATMDEAEKKRLQEAATAATAAVTALTESNRKLSQRLARSEARDIVREKLSTVRLPDNMKVRMLERICAVAPITTDGDLDSAALNTLVEAKIKEAGEDLADLTGDKLVVGMGAPAEEMLTEAEKTERREQSSRESMRLSRSLGFDDSKKAGLKIMEQGRDAFDPLYNSRKDVA